MGLGAAIRRLFGGKEAAGGKDSVERETFCIVGLGNPGQRYAHTRHNAGFEVTDLLAERCRLPIDRRRGNGLVAELNIGDKRLVICQPQTFMNLSGECVSALLQWYKCPLDHLLVVCDDIDLPAGKLRLRAKGSAGTHNGLRNILSLLPSGDFARLRVGVGKPLPEWELVDWVLSRYQPGQEQQLMSDTFRRAADCAWCWLEHGVDYTMSHMSQFNPKTEADAGSGAPPSGEKA